MAAQDTAHVDWSDEKLIEVPENALCQYETVLSLDLSKNYNIRLSTIGRFKNVTKLNLSDCDLSSIPSEIWELTKLEELNISCNYRLGGLPASICQLSKLKMLDISRCGLKTFPSCTGKLLSLEELRMNGNTFSDGQIAGIKELVGLKSLSLKECRLKTLPDSIKNLRQLEELFLGQEYDEEKIITNDFSNGLTESIGDLTMLRVLSLDNCELKALPNSIGKLNELEELIIGYNSFSSGLPSSIVGLPKLKKLDISGCRLEILADFIGKLQVLEELKMNNSISCSNGLLLSTVHLARLKKLDIRSVYSGSLTVIFNELHVLEELDISGNLFLNGLPSSLVNLAKLTKLDISCCNLKTLPDFSGKLQLLKKLLMDTNDFSDIAAIGDLIGLQSLSLIGCGLKALPESIRNLTQLEELFLGVYDDEDIVLYENDFSTGLTESIGELTQLKVLSLRDCHLKNLPNSIGNLNQLEKLELSYNDFSAGLNTEIGKLNKLKTLSLNYCKLNSLPERLDLQQLIELKLHGNKLQEYPRFTLHLKSLEKLDVSDFDLDDYVDDDDGKGNCIRELPVALADTNLRKLRLDGNPIEDPPEGIWTQGLGAIKSYLREANKHGRGQMRADTINMVGETGAGKSSVAGSLILRKEFTTELSDRTNVLQQHEMIIDKEKGDTVIINDFGGHEIYQSVTSVFLPADGLVVLVFKLEYDISKIEKTVRRWLLTAIAKSKEEIRLLIVGTHADEVTDKLPELEQWLVKLVATVFQDCVSEVHSHGISLKCLRNKRECMKGSVEKKGNALSHLLYRLKSAQTDFLNSAIKHLTSQDRKASEPVDDLLKELYKQRSNLDILSNNKGYAVRFITLSCLKWETEGLPKLYELVVSLLHRPEPFPSRWCRIIGEIHTKLTESLYITMAEVKNIYDTHCRDSGNSDGKETILRYLAKTSQVIWLEKHKHLDNKIYSPGKIVEECRKIFHHDGNELHLNLKDSFPMEWKLYGVGMLFEPVLRALLGDGAKSLPHGDVLADAEEGILPILEEFHLINRVKENDSQLMFVIPSQLSPEEPDGVNNLEQQTCQNRVTIHMTFYGKILPVSLFETFLSLMLTVDGMLHQENTLPSVWKHGIHIVSNSVNFVAKRSDSHFALTAFSESHSSSPWAVLLVALKRLNDYISVSWNGALQYCNVQCPSCVRRNQLDRSQQIGEIRVPLSDLAAVHKWDEAKRRCNTCKDLLPRSLCVATVADMHNEDSFINDENDIRDLFDKLDRKRFRNSSSNDLPEKRQKAYHVTDAQLATNLRQQYSYISERLTNCEVDEIVAKLYSSFDFLKTEQETIGGVKEDTRKARTLLNMLEKKQEKIRSFVQILQEIRRDELANLLLYGKAEGP